MITGIKEVAAGKRRPSRNLAEKIIRLKPTADELRADLSDVTILAFLAKYQKRAHKAKYYRLECLMRSATPLLLAGLECSPSPNSPSG